MDEVNFSYPHDTDPDIFREALSYSEAVTGFTASLIEKDYYCSLILHHFFERNTPLVFKGGTCLSKVYADFYRLSEDLDLVIPVAVDTPRNQRRSEMDPIKGIFSELSAIIPRVAVSKAFIGHNESRQYIGYLEYDSNVMDKQERIKIEIGIREPLLRPSLTGETRTIVVNPFSGQPLLPVFTVHAMDMKEAYAEKVRAALTRTEPAIRDLFDLFYAVRKTKLGIDDHDFLIMVKQKLDVPGNTPVDISLEYKQELDRQLEGQLRPVLRPADFDSFNMDEAFELIGRIAEAVSG
ncbi:MAG: nucleotidyl transferase AbiEii/AbiGii toxin family protein [Deltaproteobacteria bacterium]|nr:nucleotidyl transferase AbiEii/AbiGii toxin family protein [Deltaproteobacteria bacterium]MBW1738497.1 nucleotidyl transferase AbiEii/AbiGii toxin family protein [Deltaproteobacteria bacterium]MBW1910060.1 nucleotidyl transferase AbiEii/AbiGii toxin family protein [Deltaproteobacteria bacterium]MBW2035456.1 nucleotidyl transferase AbiEii/AbiGii toxin family protein [Deltaproteobacteria bacterium]MBW2115745.1 nucleotidyl transferase AbiEii/AbiGii toxin family protein [Deltaproteobacteria bact